MKKKKIMKTPQIRTYFRIICTGHILMYEPNRDYTLNKLHVKIPLRKTS